MHFCEKGVKGKKRGRQIRNGNNGVEGKMEKKIVDEINERSTKAQNNWEMTHGALGEAKPS